MLLLELFSGTGSISKVAEEHGIDCVSVDIMERFKPSVLTDIHAWDYINEPLLQTRVDYIHASPPCTEFSVAMTRRKRNIEEGMRNVKKAFEIISFFKSKNPLLKWTMENPRGFLRKQAYMNQYKRTMTSYCKYGYPYQKNTDFWYGGFNLELRPPCKWDCDQLIVGASVHKATSQKGQCRPGQKYSDNMKWQGLGGRSLRYSIPKPLCEDIIRLFLS